MENIVSFFKQPLEFIQDYILFPLENINPVSDVLDILILTAMFYFLYRFMKNRRAGKLIAGVVMILLLYLLSMLLEMKATRLVLQNFFTVGIIALFIVFQPELREALEKVGNASANLRKFNDSLHENGKLMQMIDEIVDATCAMSRECCGALIVIDRTTGLRDFTASGTPLDAEISSYLLRNIFFDKSPMHDGAVVIQNMRIAAAKCKLPLSVNEEVVKDLGTRHRAAVGLSEISDAVIIVVSEETGIISMANNHLLKRNYTAEALQHDLYLFLSDKSPEEQTAEQAEKVAAAEKKTGKSERGGKRHAGGGFLHRQAKPSPQDNTDDEDGDGLTYKSVSTVRPQKKTENTENTNHTENAGKEERDGTL